jgi:hypothetical protein
MTDERTFLGASSPISTYLSFCEYPSIRFSLSSSHFSGYVLHAFHYPPLVGKKEKFKCLFTRSCVCYSKISFNQSYFATVAPQLCHIWLCENKRQTCHIGTYIRIIAPPHHTFFSFSPPITVALCLFQLGVPVLLAVVLEHLLTLLTGTLLVSKSDIYYY